MRLHVTSRLGTFDIGINPMQAKELAALIRKAIKNRSELVFDTPDDSKITILAPDVVASSVFSIGPAQ